MSTIQNLMPGANRSRPAPFVQLRQSCASSKEAIAPLMNQLMRFIQFFVDQFGDEKAGEGDIQVAVRDAVVNAVIHGNHAIPE
jgi:hypothetical protein